MSIKIHRRRYIHHKGLVILLVIIGVIVAGGYLEGAQSQANFSYLQDGKGAPIIPPPSCDSSCSAVIPDPEPSAVTQPASTGTATASECAITGTIFNCINCPDVTAPIGPGYPIVYCSEGTIPTTP
jgi:hypothetical protein